MSRSECRNSSKKLYRKGIIIRGPRSWDSRGIRKARDHLELIKMRFPSRSDMLAVFGVVVFVCFTWTLLHFFNKVSSFLLYFTPVEIGDILAFMMAFALLESLVITMILVLLSMLLPSAWLRAGFAIKGFIILLIAAGTSILFQRTLAYEYPSILMLAATVLVPLLLSVGLIAVVRSMPRIMNLLANIQDRILIMLFIYVPIGLIGLVIVLYRNLL